MFKKLTLFVILAVIVAILVSLTSQIYNALQSGKRLDEAATNLSQLQKQNQNLRKKLAEVKSLSFVEAVARDKLNLARPNETVMVIPEEELNKILGLYKSEDKIQLPNWQGWLRLFWK